MARYVPTFARDLPPKPSATPPPAPAVPGEIQCFMIERTNLFREDLRRYCSNWENGRTADRDHCDVHPYKYHNAEVTISEAREVPEIKDDCGGGDAACFGIAINRTDPRWPAACVCGYAFQASDSWHHHFHRLYRCPDGKLVALRDGEMPPGAMFYSDWWPHPSPVDGHSLSVVLPDGHIWIVEGHANNCNVPDSVKDKNHFCWCRHKNQDGTFTVDHNPEPGTTTCTAGSGSILTPKWHGFLRNGRLITC